jgi:hypothetical protein
VLLHRSPGFRAGQTFQARNRRIENLETAVHAGALFRSQILVVEKRCRLVALLLKLGKTLSGKRSVRAPGQAAAR